jgi:hypothetical protein
MVSAVIRMSSSWENPSARRWPRRALGLGHEPPDGRFPPIGADERHPRVLPPVLPADGERQLTVGEAHAEAVVGIVVQLRVAELAQEGELAAARFHELFEARRRRVRGHGTSGLRPVLRLAEAADEVGELRVTQHLPDRLRFAEMEPVV